MSAIISPLSVTDDLVLPIHAERVQGTFTVLSANRPAERAAWEALWESWPEREVFAHPNYVRLFAADAAEALCTCWTAGTNGPKVLYPFLLHRLNGEPFSTSGVGPATDLQTPYGYGGPHFWDAADADRLAHDFWQQWGAWARENHVVSEFVRFSLFADNLLPYPGARTTDRQNVVRDLDGDEESIWADFKHKVRKNVKKAQRSGVAVAVDLHGERLDEFRAIYRHTMDRRGAAEAYYFGREFFERLHESLPGQFVYFHAIHENRVISTELVLISAENVYSFLGGTRNDAFHQRPNDLIKFEIIRWAKAQGKKRFVLGGGSAPEDGIFQYKAAFAPNGTVPFQVGRRILDPQRYDALLTARRQLAATRGENWQPRDGYFPAYRCC